MFRSFTTASVLALTISAAQAGDVVSVQFGDLNLANANDEQTLAGRVHAAAALVCASEIQDRHPVPLHYRLTRDRCIERASRATSARVMAAASKSRRFASLH